jgi:hypothetical protein
METGWGVTVQSPGASFLMLSWNTEGVTADELAEETLSSLEGLYQELDAEPGSTSIAGRQAFGHDVRFFMFDLTNTCWIRAFKTAHATVMVMWQVNDLEMESYEPVLRAMIASMKVDERAPGFQPGVN